ncbi:MAG: DUF998 domain-containing protein [Methanomicrobiales archaeon]|nr:DUF998 domain-containing protein [Methanomicrobiales archaeon]
MEPAEGASTARLRLSAACGMAAPLTFFGTVLLLGYLRPDHSPLTQLMSELGVAGSPYATVMDLVGLALTGILLILFTPAIHAALGKERGGTPGTVLVVVVGMTFVGMAFLPCDAGCVPVTSTGQIHLLLGMAGIILAAVSAFLLAYAMREARDWNGYWQYSLINGVAVLLMVLLTPQFPAIPGLWQRVIAGTVFLWTEVVAIRLYRQAGLPSPGRR